MRAEYREIIGHEHHVSAFRFPMSAWSRAAQFSEFKALDGLDSEVSETARLTDFFDELDEDCMDRINRSLSALMTMEYCGQMVSVTYFKEDTKKSGGAFVDYSGTFKYYRADTDELIFTDGFALRIGDIAELELSG